MGSEMSCKIGAALAKTILENPKETLAVATAVVLIVVIKFAMTRTIHIKNVFTKGDITNISQVNVEFGL